jgi:hypothetical protein
MEYIGKNIERMQELIQTPVNPPPSWIHKWQTESEHVLYLAQNAKDANDLEELKMLDTEAERLVKDREDRIQGS